MNKKLLSVSLLTLGTLTATVAYTVKEKPDLEKVTVGNEEAEVEITQEYIQALYEDVSIYDYDGTVKGPKLKPGAELPKGYTIDVDANSPTNAIFPGVDTMSLVMNDEGNIFIVESKIIVNRIDLPIDYTDQIVIINKDAIYHHKEVDNTIAPMEKIVKLGYTLNGSLINGTNVDGVKLTANGNIEQHQVIVRYFNRDQNYTKYEKSTTVTLIPPTQFTPNDYVEGKNYYDERVKEVTDRLTATNAPGVSVNVVFKDKDNKETKELTKAGDYKVLITYRYTDEFDKVTSTTVDETVFIINKVDLGQVTLEDKKIVYDGKPKTIEVKEILPDDVKVNYLYKDANGNESDKAPIDAGIYMVTATIDGGNNYVYDGSPIISTLTIDKAVIEGVEYPILTSVYDGTVKTALVAGTLPTGVTAEYTDNEYTEVGTYTAKVLLKGGNNYEDLTLTSTVTITKAPLTDITIDGKTVGYTGSPVSLEVKGNIPSDGD
ncbi:MBG domain-containing protein, partial [Myroides odoratimimus]|uniref:MBG domain-containing protein n=1 Tax=Myroides odoratimimus TaxID=76832 RepID=UPI0031019DEE